MKHLASLSLLLFLFIFQGSQSQNISVLGQWNNNPNFFIKYPQNINNKLIVTTAGGIRFLDVSSPSAPAPTSAFIPNPANSPLAGEFSFAVEAFGSYAYFAGSYHGHFRIVDISNINAPVETGLTYNVLGTAYQIGIWGNYAFVPSNNDTLYAIDITNKTAPTVINKINLGSQGLGICLANDYAYVSTGNGIKIVDVSNPSNMTILNTYGSGSYGRIKEDFPKNRIYVRDPSGGFTALSTVNTSTLSFIFNQPAGTGEITFNHLDEVFQLSNQPSVYEVFPFTANFRCSLATPLSGQPNDIDYKDSVFYVSTTNAVYVLKYSHTSLVTSVNSLSNASQVSVYPNPSNDKLTVKCGQDIDKASIYLCNNLGETITRFNYSKDEANILDISHLSSGIYFISISSSGYTERIKFVKD